MTLSDLEKIIKNRTPGSDSGFAFMAEDIRFLHTMHHVVDKMMAVIKAADVAVSIFESDLDNVWRNQSIKYLSKALIELKTALREMMNED